MRHAADGALAHQRAPGPPAGAYVAGAYIPEGLRLLHLTDDSAEAGRAPVGDILGWNLPAAVGLALAERDSGRNRQVLAIIGDGSLQFSIQGLWTAAQHKLPVVFVVPRNGEYAILKSFAVLEETPGVPGLELPGLDIVALATGYGCAAVEATTEGEVRQACKDALARSGPTVVVVPVAPTVPPLL